MDYKEQKRAMEELGFVRHFPVFPHHTVPNGLLPDMKEAQAAWWYCMCLVKQLRTRDDGHAQYEGELDHTEMANNTIRSIAVLYDLDSPGEILKFLPYCKLEAERIGIGWDSRMDTMHNEDFRIRDN